MNRTLRRGPGLPGIVALCLLLGFAALAGADEAVPEGPVVASPLATPVENFSLFWHVVLSHGIIFGPLMFLAALSLLCLVLWLMFQLRSARTLGRGLLPRLDQAAAVGPDRIAELARGDRSFLGQAVAAGAARLPAGLEEARRAAARVVDRMRAPHERALRWVAAIGVLSPLLGLFGSLLGTMLALVSLSRFQGELSAGMLMQGLSHAICVLLAGLSLAVFALPAYVLFKNRLQRLTLATGAAADDLLTRAGERQRLSPA
jgi:biopolymer transport protein ExbB/TolQ